MNCKKKHKRMKMETAEKANFGPISFRGEPEWKFLITLSGSINTYGDVDKDVRETVMAEQERRGGCPADIMSIQIGHRPDGRAFAEICVVFGKEES